MVGPWFTTPWRLIPNPTGLLLGILCLPSSPGLQPRYIPFACATSSHPSQPVPRVPCLPIPPGLLCGPTHTPLSVPYPFRIIPCLYHTGLLAALWRGPTGSSCIRGLFRAPSTGRSLPAPFCLGGFFLSGPVGGSTSWPRPRFPQHPCLVPTWSPAVVFLRAPLAAPLLHRLLLPIPLLPARSVLYALWRCFVDLFFFVCPRLLSCCASCLVVSCPCRVCWFFFTLLPACTHVSTALVIGSRLPLVFVSGLIALMGPAPWRSPAVPGGRPSLASLSFLPSLLSPPLPPPSPVSRPPSYCCPPAPCPPRCSSPRQGCISRALTRLPASALPCVL